MLLCLQFAAEIFCYVLISSVICPHIFPLFSAFSFPHVALNAKIVCIYVFILLNGDCGQYDLWIKAKSGVVGEIRTGFLAMFRTSFNFSTRACDFKTNLRIATCKMSLWGRKKAWELVPVVTYRVTALFICPKMPYFMQGTSSLAWGSLFWWRHHCRGDQSDWFLLSVSWSSRTVCCWTKQVRKHIEAWGPGQY